MRRTATKRNPRTRVVGEGPSRERVEKKVFRFLWWMSCRKGSSLGAGDEDREGGGSERERRMVARMMGERSGGGRDGAGQAVGEAAVGDASGGGMSRFAVELGLARYLLAPRGGARLWLPWSTRLARCSEASEGFEKTERHKRDRLPTYPYIPLCCPSPTLPLAAPVHCSRRHRMACSRLCSPSHALHAEAHVRLSIAVLLRCFYITLHSLRRVSLEKPEVGGWPLRSRLEHTKNLVHRIEMETAILGGPDFSRDVIVG